MTTDSQRRRNAGGSVVTWDPVVATRRATLTVNYIILRVKLIYYCTLPVYTHARGKSPGYEGTNKRTNEHTTN